ncbi:transcription antitermination factor NusB [Weissella ceti]|uniref:Transcription antitermination protein NusB n=1 Tax=Weissella ceti TaxID=759620 RepID=A0ABT3E613_9LACO|nr:transcription antitermination factor NusB [Weissella ceti]MCW0953672.1 transcription antitermination factor NusB [Weissella ceti]QVK12248.1 transcription antitermination factor NusB [Weissella ceti]
MHELNRHQQRQIAFQTLFGLMMNPEAEAEVIVQQVLDGDPETVWEQDLPADVLAFVNGVRENEANLSVQIADNLASGWTIDRLNKTDLVLMQLALYEAQETDTPNNVAINEALQLAHEFTDEKSRKYINAVLNKVLTENV